MRHKKIDELFSQGKWLLCPPNYFDVKYEINPWMNMDKAPLSAVASEQWKVLHHTIIRLGGFVEYVQPSKEQPDLVFTANAGLIKGRDVVTSKFKHPERQGEEPIFKKWFEDRKYNVHEVSTGHFEGEGDALFAGETLFCGHGLRSDADSYKEVCKLLNVKDYVLCELIDPRFYHLDICFCPLNESVALYNPWGLSEESVERMKKKIEMIPVGRKDAERFVCNSVVLGKNVIMPAGCIETQKELEKLGFESYPVELGEFLKGGGAAKCLSLRLQN